MTKAGGYGATDSEIEYWVENRSSLDDLYPSEAHFFVPKLKEISGRVLDVGCAAGGFFSVVKEINSSLKYSGIDVSENLVSRAKERYQEEPDASFSLYDGSEIPKELAPYQLCFSFGVLHHVPEWRSLCEIYVFSFRKIRSF